MDFKTICNCVGLTRAKKVIPYMTSIDSLNEIVQICTGLSYSDDDFLDAYAVYNYLAIRSMRRGDGNLLFDLHSQIIEQIMDFQKMSGCKARANIKSAFDMRDLGRSLAAVEFKDF